MAARMQTTALVLVEPLVVHLIHHSLSAKEVMAARMMYPT
jgi:hypothetical protein